MPIDGVSWTQLERLAGCRVSFVLWVAFWSNVTELSLEFLEIDFGMNWSESSIGCGCGKGIGMGGWPY